MYVIISWIFNVWNQGNPRVPAPIPPPQEKRPMIVKCIKEFVRDHSHQKTNATPRPSRFCEPLRRCLWIGNGGGREDLRFVQEGGFDGACGAIEGFVSTPGGSFDTGHGLPRTCFPYAVTESKITNFVERHGQWSEILGHPTWHSSKKTWWICHGRNQKSCCFIFKMMYSNWDSYLHSFIPCFFLGVEGILKISEVGGVQAERIPDLPPLFCLWFPKHSLNKSLRNSTPWKINMEPTNYSFRKDTDLPNLHDYVPY